MDLMKEGKDINEVLDMPFHFLVEMLRAERKPKKSNSFMDLP